MNGQNDHRGQFGSLTVLVIGRDSLSDWLELSGVRLLFVGNVHDNQSWKAGNVYRSHISPKVSAVITLQWVQRNQRLLDYKTNIFCFFLPLVLWETKIDFISSIRLFITYLNEITFCLRAVGAVVTGGLRVNTVSWELMQFGSKFLYLWMQGRRKAALQEIQEKWKWKWKIETVKVNN